MALPDVEHPPLAEETVNEVWELVARAEKEFMPAAPRPLVQGRIDENGVAYGLTPTIAPVEGFITVGRGRIITRIATVTNWCRLLQFGLDAQPGEKTVIHTRQFPGRRIYNFLARTETGFVIQLYEKVNGQDHAEYPIVLHQDELKAIAPFFGSVDTEKPNLSSVTSFAGVPLSFDPPFKTPETP